MPLSAKPKVNEQAGEAIRHADLMGICALFSPGSMDKSKKEVNVAKAQN